MRFNRKYQRSGTLIDSRYKSKVVEVDGRKKLSEEEIREEIRKYAGNIQLDNIEKLEKFERDDIIRKLKNAGLSIREIERVTGISRGIVAKKKRPNQYQSNGIN